MCCDQLLGSASVSSFFYVLVIDPNSYKSTSVRGPDRRTQINFLSSDAPRFSISKEVKKIALIGESDGFKFNFRRFRNGVPLWR